MGSSSSVVVFIITTLMLVSLYFTNIFIASASLGVQKLYLVGEESGVGVANEKHDQVEKVSGKDEMEGALIFFQNVRALLGLSRSFQGKSPLSKHLSPSPAPSPAPSPSPRAHQHSHFPLHHSKPKAPTLEKLPKEQIVKKGQNKTVLMAVLFSSGAAFLVCLLGSIWLITGKLKRHKRVSFKTMSMYRRKGRSRGKMSLNPDLDFLYLDALGRDLEQQTASLKQTSQGLNTIYEREESNQELIVKVEISENNTCSSSSTREIMSVHEEVELDSVHNESAGGNSSKDDRILPVEEDHHSSDDESFHSFVDDPISSNAKLSNASSASLVEALQGSPRKIRSPNSPSPSHSKQGFAPPPPPPPPPIPPPRTRFLTSITPSKPIRTLSRASGSPTLLKSRSSGSPQRSRREHSQSPRNSPRLSRATSPRPRVPPPPPLAPPPPPPPFSRFNGNSISSTKGPPASQFPPPMGKDGTPLAKLKPLHWDKVRAAPDRNMVWDKIRSSSFELDEQMIESLFGYNLQSSMKSEEGKSKSPSPSKHVLDPKRLQNITILSKAINSTGDQVCDALIRGDGLSQPQLEALSRMAPTKEEEAKLCGYKGNINELGSAERFVKVLLSVPFAFSRVEAMLYRETFEDEVVHLRNSFSMLEEACKELRSSRLFLKLLEAVLKTGNRMNVGTIRGGAKAFKLDALLKLADVKGTDGKTTLLHFVVQEIIRSEGIRVSDSIMGKINQKNNKASNSSNRDKTPEEREEDYKRMGLDLVSGLTTELYNVKKTATVDLELLASSVSHLSDGMARLNQLVSELLGGATDRDKNERFVATMKGFLGYGERALRELREEEEKVLLRVREVTEYFHGDNRNVSKDEANPLRIFVIVRDFLGMLDHVCKELRSLKVVPCSPNPLAPFR